MSSSKWIWLPVQGSLASEPAGATPAMLEHPEQAKQHSDSEVVLLPPGQKNEQRMGEDLMMTSKTHQRCEASATVQQQLEAVFGRGKLEGAAGEGGGSRRVRGRCALAGWPGHVRVGVLWLLGRQGGGGAEEGLDMAWEITVPRGCCVASTTVQQQLDAVCRRG